MKAHAITRTLDAIIESRRYYILAIIWFFWNLPTQGKIDHITALVSLTAIAGLIGFAGVARERMMREDDGFTFIAIVAFLTALYYLLEVVKVVTTLVFT